MNTLKDFSDSVVTSLVKYIKDKSSIKGLDLAISYAGANGFNAYIADYKMKSHKYYIYNESLGQNDYILVSVAMWDTKCVINISSSCIHSFGVRSLLSNFELSPTSKSSAEVRLRYLVDLNNDCNVTMNTENISGYLKVSDSSYKYEVTQEGVFSLKKELNYDLLLDIFKGLISESDYYIVTEKGYYGNI